MKGEMDILKSKAFIVSACEDYLHLLQDNSLGVGSSSEGVGLPPCAQMGLFEIVISPSLVTTMVDVLPGCTETSWLT